MSARTIEPTGDDLEMLKRLRKAVQSEVAPPELAVKIRQTIDAEAAHSKRPGWWSRPWLFRAGIPVMAALAVCFGAGVAYQLGHLRFTTGQQESFMASMLTRVSFPMKPGLDDHLHCSVYGRVPKDIPPLEQAVKNLPPKFGGLLKMVQDNVPEPFRLYSAHECRRSGRRFVHFQLKTDSKLLSVIVTRRGVDQSGVDESFVRDKIVPALAASGTSVYEAQALRFQVAAIESGEYLAYVVSDLSTVENTRVMLAMAPEMAAFLSGLRS